MDRLEIVIATEPLGIGAVETAEPVVNGEYLAELVTRAEPRHLDYAGRRPSRLLGALRDAPRSADIHVLGCICGDEDCSWATIHVEADDDDVVWSHVETSQTGTGTPVAGVGPFRFARADYERALAEPRHRVPRFAEDSLE